MKSIAVFGVFTGVPHRLMRGAVVGYVQLAAVSSLVFAMLTKLAAGRELVAIVNPFVDGLTMGSHSLVAVEACIAATVLFFLGSRLAHLILLATFVLLTIVSFGLVVRGVSDCGCFGVIKTNTKAVFAFDLTILLALVTTFPRSASGEGWSPTWREISRYAAVSLLGFLLAAAVGELISGRTPAQFIRTLSGAPAVSLESDVADLGNVPVGTPMVATFTIHNTSRSVLTIVGGTDNCSVASFCSFPASIKPGGDKTVALRVRPKGSAGELKSRYALFLASDSELSTMNLYVKANVTP